MMNQELEQKIKKLNTALADKISAIEKLLQITAQEKESILAKQINKFANLVEEKEKIITTISNIETDIEEVINLSKINQDTITEETKTHFFAIIDTVNNLLKSWEVKEKENMQLAQTYKISVEKNMTKLKKIKNIANAYKALPTTPVPQRFDQEI